MIVKTFEGTNMRDAMKSVKRVFGSEAVILSTREIPVEGSNTKMVEVKAAAPEEKKSGASSAGADHRTGADLRNIENRLDRIDTRLAQLAESAVDRKQLFGIEGAIQELKILSLESLRDKTGSIIEGLPEHLINIDQSLRLGGLDDVTLTKLIGYLKGVPTPSNLELQSFDSTEEFYRSHAIRWMIKRIKIAHRWSLIRGTNSIQAFVGPTGSGKTATIAKIAAHYIKKEKAQVLIVSYDNIRLAAHDQLRVYSKILDCPFAAIESGDELESVLLQNRDADLVLIDTAGRYPKHAEQLQDIIDLKNCNLPINFHLVQSLTDKEIHLDRSIRGFSPLGIDSLLFTKLDESWTYGEIFNLSQKWSMPLSFFSTGQKVPEDLERASRERVIERIFGL